MRIELEGTSEEVGRMLRALAGHHSFEAFQEANEERSVPLAEVAQNAPMAPECPGMFEDLVKEWAAGFDLSGTAHWEDNKPVNPNKGEKLRAVSLDRKAGKVLMWIEAQGGLTQAVHSIVEDKKVARAVAVNIAQVGSVLFPDITGLLEHFDPFEDE